MLGSFSIVILDFLLGLIMYLVLGSWPHEQCQVLVPSHGVGLKYNLKVVGCTLRFLSLLHKRLQLAGRLLLQLKQFIDECN